MPNWCSTNLTFKHKTEAEAKRFYDLVMSWRKNAMDNGFGDEWLGNFCLNSGVGFWDGDMRDKDGENLFCRGSLFDWELDGTYVYIGEESAWSPAMRMWRLICEKHNFDCEIEFFAEECGCCLYATNDPNLEGTYEIDVFRDPPEWFKDADTEHEASLESAVEFLQKALRTDETDLDKLREMEKKSDDCDWFSVHEWEHSEPDEWN